MQHSGRNSFVFSLNKSLKERGKKGDSNGKGILFVWNSSALSYPVHYYTSENQCECEKLFTKLSLSITHKYPMFM